MLTYEDVRPWTGAIRLAVQQRVMPPWYADPKYGHFSNERSLTEAEIHTLLSWTAEGAPKGDPKDMPAPMNFTEGWGIPKPDVVLQLPRPFPVPESGMVEYQYVIVPTGFTKDTWVQAAEVRPTERAVVHHIIAFVREPGSNYFKDQKPGVFFEAPPAKTDEKTDTSALPSDFLVGYAPGQPAEILQPGQGKLIKAGSDLVFEVHYTPNGKAVMDQTKLGLVLATRDAERPGADSLGQQWHLQDSPGRSRLPGRCVVRSCPAGRALGFASPHAHARAKISNIAWYFPTARHGQFCRCRPTTGTGSSGTTCRNRSFYPRGQRSSARRISTTRANNPENPDPTKTVIWGQQNWDEMMVGFFNLVYDANMSPKDLLPDKEPNRKPNEKEDHHGKKATSPVASK